VDYLSKTAILYPSSDLLEAGVESEEKADLEVHAVCFTGGEHLCAFLWCECHRFIAKHVQAAFRCSDYLLAV
jgi:hypothetical protein